MICGHSRLMVMKLMVSKPNEAAPAPAPAAVRPIWLFISIKL